MRATRLLQTGLCIAALFGSASTRADWSFGPIVSVIGGISDVSDLMERQPGIADVYDLPIGAGLIVNKELDSGVRIDFGAGPAFVMLADDADHTEIPVYGTVGYSFRKDAAVSPYVRLGLAYHGVSGDFVSRSESGTLVAFGVEWGRNRRTGVMGFEISKDDTEIDFIDVDSATGRTKLETYGTMASFYVRF